MSTIEGFLISYDAAGELPSYAFVQLFQTKTNFTAIVSQASPGTSIVNGHVPIRSWIKEHLRKAGADARPLRFFEVRQGGHWHATPKDEYYEVHEESQGGYSWNSVTEETALSSIPGRFGQQSWPLVLFPHRPM